MEKELKDMLIRILANQAALYKKLANIENRSVAVIHPNRPLSYFSDEMTLESDELFRQLKQMLNEE